MHVFAIVQDFQIIFFQTSHHHHHALNSLFVQISIPKTHLDLDILQLGDSLGFLSTPNHLLLAATKLPRIDFLYGVRLFNIPTQNMPNKAKMVFLLLLGAHVEVSLVIHLRSLTGGSYRGELIDWANQMDLTYILFDSR